MFSVRGLTWFIGIYVATVVGTLLAAFCFPEKISSVTKIFSDNTRQTISILSETAGTLLTVQATMIGVAFPLAVALISLLLQQRGQVLSSARVEIYYHESMALGLAVSSVLLIIALVAQVFLPLYTFEKFTLLPPATIFTPIMLAFLHGIWLVVNSVALLHFFRVSFRFANPTDQQLILRQFVANRSIPRDLEDRLAEHYFSSPTYFGLMPDMQDNSLETAGAPSIAFGDACVDRGDVEVEHRNAHPQVLYDVRFMFVRCVALKWYRRAKNKLEATSVTVGHDGGLLMFPQKIGDQSSGSVHLCRNHSNTALRTFEKQLIKYAFVFRDVV